MAGALSLYIVNIDKQLRCPIIVVLIIIGVKLMKRFVSLFLVMLIVLSSVFVLSACSDDAASRRVAFRFVVDISWLA